MALRADSKQFRHDGEQTGTFEAQSSEKYDIEDRPRVIDGKSLAIYSPWSALI
jgi:hypothetical protein